MYVKLDELLHILDGYAHLSKLMGIDMSCVFDVGAQGTYADFRNAALQNLATLNKAICKDLRVHNLTLEDKYELITREVLPPIKYAYDGVMSDRYYIAGIANAAPPIFYTALERVDVPAART